MRIIGGILKGRNIKVPNNLPVRPTTNFASEGLFNVLNNTIDFESVSVLDLFSGTGHIAIEFASRGCKDVVAIDNHFNCLKFLKEVSSQFKLPISTIKADVFSFLKNNTRKFDLIFADPPYDLPNIPEIHQLVFEGKMLNEGGTLIIEHGPRTKLEELPYFVKHKKYGNVNFSYFELN